MTDRLHWLFTVGVLSVVGCSSPLRGDPEEQFLSTSYVRDDSWFLPEGEVTFGLGVPLEGVRVEYVDGPKVGAFAVTGPDGGYRLVNPGTFHARVRASKGGYEPRVRSMNGCFGLLCTPDFWLGQSPHTLWGDVRGGTSSPPLLDGVQVAVLDGPNAGKVTMTDATGRYRIDTIVTSAPFNIRLSKPGYQSVTVLVFSSECTTPASDGSCDVSGNMRWNAFLPPVG